MRVTLLKLTSARDAVPLPRPQASAGGRPPQSCRNKPSPRPSKVRRFDSCARVVRRLGCPAHGACAARPVHRHGTLPCEPGQANAMPRRAARQSSPASPIFIDAAARQPPPPTSAAGVYWGSVAAQPGANPNDAIAQAQRFAARREAFDKESVRAKFEVSDELRVLVGKEVRRPQGPFLDQQHCACRANESPAPCPRLPAVGLPVHRFARGYSGSRCHRALVHAHESAAGGWRVPQVLHSFELQHVVYANEADGYPNVVIVTTLSVRAVPVSGAKQAAVLCGYVRDRGTCVEAAPARQLAPRGCTASAHRLFCGEGSS